MMKIIDNFLQYEDVKKIQDTMIGSDCNFPWYFNDSIVYNNNEEKKDISCYQFTHKFYCDHKPNSDYIHILDIIIEKINPSALVRIKANLLPHTQEKRINHFHIDILNFLGKTAIFYVNTNNGKTIFQDGSEVDSIENRLLIFDSNLMHTGTTCSDQSVRCVINFNYYA